MVWELLVLQEQQGSQASLAQLGPQGQQDLGELPGNRDLEGTAAPQEAQGHQERGAHKGSRGPQEHVETKGYLEIQE